LSRLSIGSACWTLANVSIFDSKALQNQDYNERWQALIGS